MRLIPWVYESFTAVFHLPPRQSAHFCWTTVSTLHPCSPCVFISACELSFSASTSSLAYLGCVMASRACSCARLVRRKLGATN